MKWFLAIAALLAMNGLDYQDLGNRWDEGKQRYVLLAMVPLSFLALNKRLGWEPAAFGALALLSFIVHNYRASHDSVLPIIAIFGCLALACWLVELGEQFFGSLLIASGVVQAAVGVLQWARAEHILPFGFWHHPKPDGFCGGNTFLAALLAICLCPALWRRNWWASALMVAGILACQSVGGIVCLGIVLAVWACERQRFLNWWPFLVVTVPIAIALFVHAAYGRSLVDSDGRFFMWGIGLRAIARNPWFGGGIGIWDQRYKAEFESEIISKFNYHLPSALHNDYIDFAMEYGLVALAGLVVAIALWARKFRPTWPHAVCAAGLVDALFSFPGSQVYLALPFTVCWAFSRRNA